jgi:hypothetical protein
VVGNEIAVAVSDWINNPSGLLALRHQVGGLQAEGSADFFERTTSVAIQEESTIPTFADRQRRRVVVVSGTPSHPAIAGATGVVELRKQAIESHGFSLRANMASRRDNRS